MDGAGGGVRGLYLQYEETNVPGYYSRNECLLTFSKSKCNHFAHFASPRWDRETCLSVTLLKFPFSAAFTFIVLSIPFLLLQGQFPISPYSVCPHPKPTSSFEVESKNFFQFGAEGRLITRLTIHQVNIMDLEYLQSIKRTVVHSHCASKRKKRLLMAMAFKTVFCVVGEKHTVTPPHTDND